MSIKKTTFQAIKKAFSTASVLQHFDLNKKFIVETGCA